MDKSYKYAWYIADTIAFILINALVWTFLPIKLEVAISSLSWTVIIIMAMGIWRLTDIITHEGITDFIRAPFKGHERGLKGLLGVLTTCNSCMGVWVAMLVFYAYVLWPWPTLALMVVMSLTFFERFLSKIYNFLEKRD